MTKLTHWLFRRLLLLVARCPFADCHGKVINKDDAFVCSCGWRSDIVPPASRGLRP